MTITERLRDVGISVLGPLLVDGRADLTRRDRVVLAVLTLEQPRSVSSDRLGEALWPNGAPPVSAAKVVQGCIVRLRNALGPEAIRTTEHGYRLERVHADVTEFERGVARTREFLALGQHDRAAHAASATLALWRGPPYPDLDPWEDATTEIARLGELRLQAEELHVEALLGRGDHDGAVASAAHMVSAEPHRERRWCQLALAEFRAGRQAEALAALRSCRELLRNELGVDPGPEVAALEQSILRQDPVLLVGERRAASSVCPWPGLSPFDTDHADDFFGREADLVSALAQLRARGVLVVAGPSGVGKSSFVRAGVAAALMAQGSRVRVVTPSRGALEADDDVLVLDQTEELFALPQADRESFLAALTEQARLGFLVLALRADRVSDAAGHPHLARLVEQGLFLLSGLDETGQRAAIEGPAAREGLHVEPGLVDLLVRDLEGEPGALPLLSHALVQTWERREGSTLTVEGYRATGRVHGAVARTAEELYAGLTVEQQAALPALMLRLVAAGPAGEPMAARVPRSLLGPASHVLLETLVDSRLITADSGMVTLAHESLVRAWPRLRGWLDDDVEGRRTLQHLSASAQAWQGLGRPPSELYRGVRLARALEWRNSSGIDLSPEEEQFLAAGQRLAEDEERTVEDRARRQARANRRLRVLAGALGLVVVAALAIGGVALGQSQRADRAATTASLSATDAAARSLGARALLADDPALALLLGAAAVRLGRSAGTRAALASVIARRPRLIGVAALPAGTTTSTLVRGPDGILYAADRARGVFALATEDRQVIADHRGTSQQPDVWETALATAGNVVAVAADQRDRQPVRLLDPMTLMEVPGQLGGWPRRRVGVSSLATDASGRFLAAAMATSTIESDTAGNIDGGRTMVWDLAAPGRPVVATIRTPENFFNGVGLSPDGRTVYVTNPLTAYRVATGRRMWSSPESNWEIEISVSPDGSTLATVDPRDPTVVALVDARTGRVDERLPGHTQPITGLAHSPDGTLLAASATDGRALVWDARTLDLIDEIEVGVEQVTGVTFGGDDLLHTLTSNPAQVQTWDLGGYRSFVQRHRVRQPVVAGNSTMIRVNHAGTMAATLTTDDDGTRIGVVDATSSVATTRDLTSLDTGYIGAGGWSSDDTRYATGYADGAVQVVDARTGREIVRGRVGDGMVAEVAYSADDGQLLVAGVDGGVRRVDPGTLEPTGPQVQVPEMIYAATISPDGTSAFVAAGGTRWRPYWQEVIDHWYVIDLERGTILDTGDLGVSSAFYTAYSPDGSRVAVGGRGGDVALIDVATGRLVREPVRAHDGAAVWLAWDSSGRFFTSGSSSGEVALFDGESGDLLGLTSVPAADGVAVGGFRSDDTLLIATSSGWLGVWDPGVDGSVAYACAVAGRDLSRDEWAEVVPGRPWRSTCQRESGIIAGP